MFRIVAVRGSQRRSFCSTAALTCADGLVTPLGHTSHIRSKQEVITVAVDLDDVAARQSRLLAAVAELAALPFEELPADVLDSVLCSIESAERVLSTVGYDAINALRAHWPKRLGRLRDHLANMLRNPSTPAVSHGRMGITEGRRNHPNQTPLDRGCRLSNRCAWEVCHDASGLAGSWWWTSTRPRGRRLLAVDPTGLRHGPSLPKIGDVRRSVDKRFIPSLHRTPDIHRVTSRTQLTHRRNSPADD